MNVLAYILDIDAVDNTYSSYKLGGQAYSVVCKIPGINLQFVYENIFFIKNNFINGDIHLF